MNYEYIKRLNDAIQYFDALGAWATAEMLRGWLNEELRKGGLK